MSSVDIRYAGTMEHPEGVLVGTSANFYTQKEQLPFQKDPQMVLEVRHFSCCIGSKTYRLFLHSLDWTRSSLLWLLYQWSDVKKDLITEQNNNIIEG